MITIPVCLLMATVLETPQHQSVFKVVPPESVQLNADKLEEIDTLMQKEVDAGKIAGCLALVARGDKVAWFRTWGDQNRAKKIPMRDDTIFRIYSMSKPVTSVAVMQLVERGKIQLDDPVEKYLPELADRRVLVKSDSDDELKTVPAKKSITIRDLLRHTSGLTYGFFGNSKIDRAYRKAGVLVTEPTIADTVTRLGKIPLLYQPGTRWHYSVSTDVLGRVVEVAAGERFDKYLQQHILKPLDMRDTSFIVPRQKQSRFAEMYRGTGANLKPAPAFSSRRFVSEKNLYFSGGGGLCSTTRDYLRFCRALLNGGELDGARILQAATIKEMTSDQLSETVNARFGFKFGLGFSIQAEGEYSWGGAAGTRFWINPKRNLIGIYMIQINPYGGRKYGDQMKKIVYAADERAAAPAKIPAAPMP